MYIKYLAPLLYVCSHTRYISSVKLIGRYERNAFYTSMIASRALSTVNPLNYLHKSNRDNNNNYYDNNDDNYNNDRRSLDYNDKVDMYTINDKILQNKKMIYVSPGGLRGFYQLGICNYIKKNFEIDDYVFTGSCSGAWNCLLLSMKPYVNVDKFIQSTINLDLKDINNINEAQARLKYEILENYCTENFDLNKLFIGITLKERSTFKTDVYSGFDDLEEAIDACIASSFINTFKLNMSASSHLYDKFDTKENPTFMNVTTSVLHISPYMWANNSRKKSTLDMLLPNKFNLNKLYHDGYRDTDLNHRHLRYILHDSR